MFRQPRLQVESAASVRDSATTCIWRQLDTVKGKEHVPCLLGSLRLLLVPPQPVRDPVHVRVHADADLCDNTNAFDNQSTIF